MEILLLFAAFFTATIIGRNVARQTLRNEKAETDRYCHGKREEIEAEMQSMVNKLNDEKAAFNHRKFEEQRNLEKRKPPLTTGNLKSSEIWKKRKPPSKLKK